jgi:hypothetical protein
MLGDRLSLADKSGYRKSSFGRGAFAGDVVM